MVSCFDVLLLGSCQFDDISLHAMTSILLMHPTFNILAAKHFSQRALSRQYRQVYTRHRR